MLTVTLKPVKSVSVAVIPPCVVEVVEYPRNIVPGATFVAVTALSARNS